MSSIRLIDISTVYADLTHHMIDEIGKVEKTKSAQDIIQDVHKLSIGKYFTALERYTPNLEFEILEEFDFSSWEPDLYKIIYPLIEDSQIDFKKPAKKSRNKIYKSGDKYICQIVVNSRLDDREKRFAYMKEAGHILFAVNSGNISKNYPYPLDQGYEDFVKSMKLNTEHQFSFEHYIDNNPKYKPTVSEDNDDNSSITESWRLELAAEILAFLMLTPSDELIRAHEFMSDTTSIIDPKPFSDRFNVPEHYTQHFLADTARNFVQIHKKVLLEAGLYAEPILENSENNTEITMTPAGVNQPRVLNLRRNTENKYVPLKKNYDFAKPQYGLSGAYGDNNHNDIRQHEPIDPPGTDHPEGSRDKLPPK